MSGPLVGEKELRRLAEAAVRHAEGDGAEALVIARTGSLSRFANSAIHQNVSSRECEVRLRVVRGTRVATLSTDRLDDDGLRRLAADASALAKIVPENPQFGGLPPARPIPAAPSAYVERTALATPVDRAKAVQRICGPARAKGLRAAGFVSTNVQEIAVASTAGVWAYAPQTTAEAQCAAIGDEGAAFAQRVSTDLAKVDVDAVAREASDKAVAAQRPRDLAPGEHEVVLEPYAAYDLVAFLAAQLTGLAVEEGRSFVAGRFGERVTGPVTLVDDPYDPECFPRAFDFEGQPSDRVTLIEDGVARAVVYDAQTAHRMKARNTGHANPSGVFMPTPMHRRLEAGTKTREELIRSVKKGVLVTRFWYTRWVHQLRTIVTGMTRDGTFAIVDGEIAYPVKNFRFTQSYHEALEGVRGVGSDLHLLVAGEAFGVQASAARVPALHLASFRFTGATQY
ncbi:MAG TPA: TldD/PmbA family protein [Candidatus Limnocylindria bacterium]|nr:TldD/PmbA family protein [Candidatus Limnocylindria bacterium]